MLGDDITFPGNADVPSRKLLDLYCSRATHELIAELLEVAPQAIEPRLVHAFFARLAWIDDAPITSPEARLQLEDLLYRTSPLSNQASRLGTGEFSELGSLLEPVPEDLQMWMLQFKHGLHWEAAAEWLTHCPIGALQHGLSRCEPNPPQNALAALASVIERLLPSAADYRDRPLADSLARQLPAEATQQFIHQLILASLGNEPVGQARQIEWSPSLDATTCRQLFTRLALATLGANDEPWLALALHMAAQAPEVQAFSFATQLIRRHPQLSSQCCLRLGSLLLTNTAQQSAPPLEPLSSAQRLCEQLPAFAEWCPYTSPDDLFGAIGLTLLCETSSGNQQLRVPAHEAWQAMMQSCHFVPLFQPLLRKVGWYAGDHDQATSPRATQALAARAISERFLGPWQRSARSIARDFRDRWATELSHQELLEQIDREIVERNPGISPAAARLLEYLLLRDMAPELLVNRVPGWLYYGRSLQSVALIHGARLLEAILPGAACHAVFDELVALPRALSSSQDPEIRRLWSQTLIIPALRYAIAHDAIGSVAERDLHTASSTQIEAALAFLKRQQEAFSSDAKQLSASVPDRQRLAEEQLSQAGVNRVYWNKRITGHETWAYLQRCGLEKSSRYAWDFVRSIPGSSGDYGSPSPPPITMNLLQLVTMGDIYRTGLPTVPELYDSAFRAYQASWLHTNSRIIGRLLEELPARHRARLHAATCEANLVTFASKTSDNGLLLRCLSGDHREDFDEHNAASEHYFEIIPGAGIVRPCQQQFHYRVEPTGGFSGNLGETIARLQRYEDAKRRARQTPLLPFDSDAYLTGTPSRRQPFNTPLKGTLIPAATQVYGAEQDERAFLLTLAKAAAAHLYETPLTTLRQAHTHPTTWEELNNQDKQVGTLIARLLLPLYGCINDLADGDHSVGVIAGCVVDTLAVLIPTGVFARSILNIVKKAGKLTFSATCSAMTGALGELVLGLARQSPAMIFKDLARGFFWLSRNTWTLLKDLSGTWLNRLLHKLPLLRLTGDGKYCLPPAALHDWLDLHELQTLANVDATANVLVHNLATAERSSYRLLDPHSNKPFGPLLVPVSPAEPSTLTALSHANWLGAGSYPAHIAYELSPRGTLSIALPAESVVHLRYKGRGVYDIGIDGHTYRLDTTRSDSCLTRLSEAPVGDLSTLEEETMLCRPIRELTEPDPCSAFTRLVSTPIEGLPSVDSSLNLGREAGLAFECREFHLDRRLIAASAETAERTLDVFVHEEKFCKWDYQIIPARGRRRATLSPHKKIIPLNAEERAVLGLPEQPRYLPQISGRMSDKRKFGLLPDTSANKAKLLNPQIPTVELDSIVAGVADKRILRGVRYETGGRNVIYVEVDAGHFYKAVQGPGRLTFVPVTDISEINEYLRLSEQFRFVTERPYNLKDRENIAKLLFNVAVHKNDPDIKTWVLHSAGSKDYASYAQWCSASQAENRFLHFAENILSSESSQINLIEEAKSIIPDWQQVGGRSSAERLHIAGILNNLFPVHAGKVPWPHLNFSSLSNATASAEVIGQQLKGSNLAYAAIRTRAGEHYVVYALSGGQKYKNLHLKPHLPGQTSRRLGNVTYIDAGALMHGRAPDPDFTDLPVLRSSDRLHVVEHDRRVDSERLIATIIKETFAQKDIATLQVFTRYNTCRSCGGVVLPQLKIEFPGSDFSVTYLQHYDAW
ncbi:deaminase domain-containing protein [Pseudomonas sp. SDI]|uniref:deaminase domain-containing protein n=1 Tax=Pseudomonas sp. SDI TaxID=2170734 RepID=UPI001401D79E|nr:deaminase domain-containing protein [Pseudomonas sp. SDI]